MNLRLADVDNKSQGSQQGGPSRGRGASVDMIQAAEERRRSRSITGILEGDKFREDRITQVMELAGVVTGLT